MALLREGKTMKLKILFGLAIATVSGWQAAAQIYDTNGDFVQTFAGSGFSGYVDGVGQLTMFNNPNSVVADSHGNLFVWDSNNARIREIASDGTVMTFAGGGTQTMGVGTNVAFYFTTFGGMTIDGNDTLWLTGAYSSQNLLYKISTGAAVTTTNLPSSFFVPAGICADSSGNIYISVAYGSNPSANRIYRLSADGNLNVFAGSGNQGYSDGNGIFTAFNNPAALTCDQANSIYVWDSGNRLIRRIDASQNVTTFAGKYQNSSNADGAGTNAAFSGVSQICFDNSGNLYLACGSCIRRIDTTTNVVTLAGSFTQTGYTNGAGNLARFNGADGVCIAGGTIYVADSSNQRIRSITNNPTPQVVSGANLGIGTFRA